MGTKLLKSVLRRANVSGESHISILVLVNIQRVPKTESQGFKTQRFQNKTLSCSI